MEKPLCIGIAGGSASGKTALARQTAARLDDRAVLVELDWYYKDLAHLGPGDRAKTNFDHPGALEWERLAGDVEALVRGAAIDAPVYDFTQHLRATRRQHLEPKPILLVEGIHCLHDPRLRALLEIKVFVELDAGLRLARRLRRDTLERGRAIESVLRQYEEHVRPMHAQYVVPAKQHADFIVSGEDIEKETDRVLEAIREREK